jgi:hypothetical protein
VIIRQSHPLPFFVTADSKELERQWRVVSGVWQAKPGAGSSGPIFWRGGVLRPGRCTRTKQCLPPTPMFLEECENKWFIFLRVKKCAEVVETKGEFL